MKGVGVLAMEDCFEMEVATRRPSGGTHTGNDLAHLDGIPSPDSDGFQVVVGGDQAVAVVYFHTVAAAPGMPARGANHTGVCGIDPRAAVGSIVLAKMEVPRRSGEGADPLAEGRTWPEHFKGRHQGPFRRPFEPGRRNVELDVPILGDGGDDGTAEGDQCPAIRVKTACQSGKADAAGACRGYRRARLPWRPGRLRHPWRAGGSQGKKRHRNDGAGGQYTNGHSAGAS